MRRVFFFLVFIPLFVFAQRSTPSKDSLKYKYTPVIHFGMEVFNLLDNYPALLFYGEVQLGKKFAIMQEMGPVLDAEVSNYENFNSYKGLKSRTEIKLYQPLNGKTGNRVWYGLDFAFQLDEYEDNFWVQYPGYQQLVEGKIDRQILASHARVGVQKINEKGTFITAASIGVGASFYEINAPSEELIEASSITESSPFDPVSVNIRVHFGFSLGQKKS